MNSAGFTIFDPNYTIMMITRKIFRIVLATLLPVSVFAQSSDNQPTRPEKQFVLDYISKTESFEKFGRISDAIWSYAELGLREYKSSALLAKTLEEEGFKVEMGLAGMPTCFVASYGSGEPVIGILGEYDALPMISQKALVPTRDPLVEGAPGHGCGHNTMGTAGIAAAIAVKNAMDEFNIKGTIKFFGSPAEETLISRPYMIRAGLFEGVDAVIDNHHSSKFGTSYGVGGCHFYLYLKNGPRCRGTMERTECPGCR